MPTTIKYVGRTQRWPELPVTGKPALWMPGQQEERSDAEAVRLLATGFFQETGSLPALMVPSSVSAPRIILPDGAARALAFGNAAVNLLLAGDSMADHAEWGTSATAASYATATGLLTCTVTNHFRATGDMARVWNYNYASLRAAKFAPIARVDANTFTIQLNPAEHTDLPNGALAATIFVVVQGPMNWTHPFGLAQLKLGMRFNVVFNGAQNGDTSTNFLARLPALIAAWPQARAIYWQALGLNDQSSTWSIPERDSIAANRESIRLMAQSMDVVFLATTTPTEATEARASNAAMQRIRNINASVREEAARYSNCAYLEFHDRIVDPTNVNGYAVPANLRGDRIHWSYTGSDRVVDQVVVPAIKARVPNPRSPLVATAAECHANSRPAISSVSRASDGITVTVNTSAAHAWRAGDDFRVTRISAAENGVFVILDTPSATSFRYLNPGAVGAISAGSAHYTRCRQAFGNPLLLTSGGAAPLNGISGTTADVASLLRVYNQAGTTGTLTCAASLVAAPDGPEFPGIGQMQQLLVTAAAALDRPAIGNNGTSALLNDLVLNQRYTFGMRYMLMRVAGVWANIPISEMYGMFALTWSTGEIYAYPFLTGWDGAEAPTVKSDQDWCVLTPPISTTPPQAGSTLSQCDFAVYPRFSGSISGGAQLAIRAGQITARAQ